MAPKQFYLDYVEFYITSVCNFNCTGCNRFNNYAFAGSQRWADHAETYHTWSQILDLGSYTVLGGEPMTNPDYIDWLVGLHRLWPGTPGIFLTNGHYLDSDNRELYDAIASTNGMVKLCIGLHNQHRLSTVLERVQSWLQGPVDIERSPKNLWDLPGFSDNWRHSYQQIRDPHWPDCDTVNDWHRLPEQIRRECETQHNFSPDILAQSRRNWHLVDDNGVRVEINFENYFYNGALIQDDASQSFRLHNSDRNRAHDVCVSKTCHHFDKGRLYKCGPVALLPEFDQQYNLDITDQDRDLIHSYQPGTVDDLKHLEHFFKNLDRAMPQCKFCPEQLQPREIWAEHGKKVKFNKKNRHQKDSAWNQN